MGLAIYVTKLKPTKKPKDSENYDLVQPYALKGFFRSLLKQEKKYSEIVGSELMLQLSYGWYNTFRDTLTRAFLSKSDEAIWAECSRLSKDDKYPNGLYHIINFTDNEGFIGPAAVKEINQYFERCKQRGTLKKKKDKFKKLNKDLVPYLNDFIKMIKIASEENAYLEFK